MSEELSVIEGRMHNKAETYFEKYRDQMDLLEKSPLAKVRPISHHDIFALGEQLEAFEIYKQICEEDGSINQLGKLPNVAFDVLTVVYGTSIIPILASTQPIGEESGTVYFKNVKALSTRGNLTANQTITSPTGAKVTPHGYASDAITAEGFDTVDATVTYSYTLGNLPVRRESVSVTCPDLTGDPYGKDDGTGAILGVGLSGSINYTTGVVAITFAANPGAHTDGVLIDYQVNFEAATDIPQITSFWDSTSVKAKIYALKGTVGLLQSFAMRKRFGLIAEDELAKDLVGEINSEIGGDLIRKIAAAAVGTAAWDRTPASGISYYEHKMTFKDALALAEGRIVTNAGRGTISVMAAGATACSTMSTLPGFTKITDGRATGAHLFGTLDGTPVVRVPDANDLAADTIIPLWKGTSPFEAAAVYAPYMPLAITSTLPNAPNPLGNMRAAAVWASVQVLVANFITKLTISTS